VSFKYIDEKIEERLCLRNNSGNARKALRRPAKSAAPKKMAPAQLRARRDRGKFMICKNSGTLSCFLSLSARRSQRVVAEVEKRGSVCVTSGAAKSKGQSGDERI
jgi:hypothetical protein